MIKLAKRRRELAAMVNHGTIFYVDDNPKSRRLLTSVIRSCGFEVVSFGDPIEALSRIKTSHPDLALLDYLMPHLTGAVGEKNQEQDGRHPCGADLWIFRFAAF